MGSLPARARGKVSSDYVTTKSKVAGTGPATVPLSLPPLYACEINLMFM
jgi:hypothetical protein